MQQGPFNMPPRRMRMRSSIDQQRMFPPMGLPNQQDPFRISQAPVPPSQPPQGMMPMRGMRNSFRNQSRRMPGQGQKSGLLAKILGKRNQQAPTPASLFSVPGVAASQEAPRTAGGGGIIQSLTGSGSLSTMLNNTQKVLQAAESLGPMVSQYGPLLKNIPAMWKIYQGLKNGDDVKDSVSQPHEEKKESTNSPNLEEELEIQKNKATEPLEDEEKKKTVKSGESLPKLFI
jgi:hypothetical protein